MIVDIEEYTYDEVMRKGPLKRRLRQLTNRDVMGSEMVPMLTQGRHKDSLRIFVARYRGRVVGWLTAHHENNGGFEGYLPREYILNVFVDPRYRQRGVASLLIREAKDELRYLKRRFDGAITADFTEQMWRKGGLRV